MATADVRQEPPVRDRWSVLARRDTEDENLTTRRVWLQGAETGRLFGSGTRGGAGPLAAVGANTYVWVAVLLLILISPGVRAVDERRSPVVPTVARHERDS